MEITLTTAVPDSESRTDIDPTAGDGGFCHAIAETNYQSAARAPLDVKGHPEIGAAAAVKIWTTYVSPDAEQAVTLRTSGGQEINLYAQTIFCPEGEDGLKGKLLADTRINGVWFQAGETVEFHDNFAFAAGTLLNNVELIPGVIFKAGTEARYYGNESLTAKAKVKSGTLWYDQEFNGIAFPAGHQVTFHTNKNLKNARLPRDKIIADYNFAAGYEIEFDEQGKLARGTLRMPQTFYGIVFPALTEIHFHPDGSFAGARLPRQQKWQSKNVGMLELAAHTEIEVYADGTLAKATLFANKEIIINEESFFFKAGSEMQFHENGNLKTGDLFADKTIAGLEIKVTLAAGATVELDEASRLRGGSTRFAVPLPHHRDDNNKPIVAQKGEWLGFYPDGKVKIVTLAENTSFEGRLFKQGSLFHFQTDRSLQKGTLAEDTPLFPERYENLLWLAQDTECGYNDNGDFYGYLADPLAFELKINQRPIALTIGSGQKITFQRDTDRIQGGILNRNVEIWPGVRFAAGEWFEIDLRDSKYFSDENHDDDDPEFLGGTLTDAITIDDHQLHEGQFVKFYGSGKVLGYNVEKEIAAYPDLYPDLKIGGERWAEFFEGTSAISGAKLAADYEPFPEIYDDNDNPLLLAQDQWISFSEDLILKGGKLAEDFRIDHDIFGEIFLKKGEWIDLGSDGRVLGGRLSEDTDIFLPNFDNLSLQGDQWVDFYEDGSIQGGRLAENAVYYHPDCGPIELLTGEFIEFYPDGTLKGGFLAENLTLNNPQYGPIELRATEWIEFYDDGSFKSGTLENEVFIINDIVGDFYILDGEEAEFYPLQTLQRGTLSDTMVLETAVGPLEFLELSEIELTEDQDVLGGYLSRQYVVNGEKYRFGDWIEIVREYE